MIFFVYFLILIVDGNNRLNVDLIHMFAYLIFDK